MIRPEAKKLGIDVIRIDQVTRPGIIFQDLQRKIEDAKAVIADITAPNQNVYYEVGYAHALLSGYFDSIQHPDPRVLR